ncbi:MAG: HAMP domain-containing sensor histidine kinase [bacterium]|nr:HAMP domain-containing sensor histidine kinase [bacterium]
MEWSGEIAENWGARDANFLVAAHEMKAPLSIVRQLSLALGDDALEFSPEQKRRMIAQISSTSERALRLVSDLTKISRLEDALFEMEPINCSKVCDDILREVDGVFRISGRKIAFKRPKKSDLILANYDLLRSILLNFTDNALVASNKKSTTEISVSAKENRIRIAVRDYGQVLPKEVWRAVKSGSAEVARAGSSPQSSGLGIYISKNFAKKMGAKVGVIKHRDGSTFYVDLLKSEQLSLL